jgi:hypothetical protein
MSFWNKKKESVQTVSKPSYSVSHGPSLYQRLKEAAVVVSGYSKSERLSHPAYMDRYNQLLQDPTVSIAVDTLKNMVVPDFYFEMPESDEQGNKVDAKHPNLKKVEAWKKNTKAVKRVKEIVGSAIGKGFCPFEVVFKEGYRLKPLPVESFYIYRSATGDLLKYTQEDGYKQINTWQPTDKSIALFILDEDTDHAYGEAIVESLVGLIDTRKNLNDDMGRIIHRFSSPLQVTKGVGDISPVKEEIVNREVDEGIYIGGMNDVTKDLAIEFHEPNPQVKFLPYIESVDAQIGQRLNAPLILTLKNATEASATKMIEAVERWVQSTQNELADLLEEVVFKPLCGSGPIPLLRWGAPMQVLNDISLTDISTITDKAISKKQAQDLIRKKGIALIEDEEFLKPKEPILQNPTDPEQGKPLINKDKTTALELQLQTIKASHEEGHLIFTEALKEGDRAIINTVEKAKMEAKRQLKQLGKELTPESEAHFQYAHDAYFRDFRNSILPLEAKTKCVSV